MKFDSEVEENKSILNEEKKKEARTQVVLDGHTYDLEDGRLVSYIEIYIPFFRKYVKVDSCDLFKYIFGKFKG